MITKYPYHILNYEYFELEWVPRDGETHSKTDAFHRFQKSIAYEDTYINKRGNKILIKKGQCLLSQRELREIFNWSKSKLNNWLNTLIEKRFISIETNNTMSIITLLNHCNITKSYSYQKSPQKNQHFSLEVSNILEKNNPQKTKKSPQKSPQKISKIDPQKPLFKTPLKNKELEAKSTITIAKRISDEKEELFHRNNHKKPTEKPTLNKYIYINNINTTHQRVGELCKLIQTAKTHSSNNEWVVGFYESIKEYVSSSRVALENLENAVITNDHLDILCLVYTYDSDKPRGQTKIINHLGFAKSKKAKSKDNNLEIHQLLETFEKVSNDIISRYEHIEQEFNNKKNTSHKEARINHIKAAYKAGMKLSTKQQSLIDSLIESGELHSVDQALNRSISTAL